MADHTVRPPADNNVVDVLNAIDNYTCGPIRALAQDPPQNSSDARRDGQTVEVAYRVLERRSSSGGLVRILTITDSGTTGLDGRILYDEDLKRRQAEEGGLVIRQGENWAAWEAMRYSKEGEDKLGSRGQGKYAYMYHSMHSPPGARSGNSRELSRMIILYDTLLPSGDYRFGARYHNPGAWIVPPVTGDDAKEILRTAYRDEHFEVPLELEPLEEPGTRVIIPFLSDDSYRAIHDGELVHWLEVGWWRKIQKGELRVTVETEAGLQRTIGVPSVWDGTLWSRDGACYHHEKVRLPSDLPDRRRIIKRIVLTHEEATTDLPGPAQWTGVQLLRGGQWITTLEVSEFTDWIPREYREGLRGFVEFDRRLEGELRAIENPAHDDFNRRTSLYQEIIRVIREHVKQFAIERGWSDDEPAPEPQFDELVRELTDLFVDADAGSETTGDVTWTCSVRADFPGRTARVDWGDSLRVRADCTRSPVNDGEFVIFRAFLIRPDGSRAPIFDERSRPLRSRSGAARSRAGVDFGSLDAEHPGGCEDPVFTTPGRYSIEALCVVDGHQVASGRCSFYVASDPPEPPRRGLTLQLEAHNAETAQPWVDFGELLVCAATVRNYRQEDAESELAVTIEGAPYVMIRQLVELEGAVPGGSASSRKVISRPRVVAKDGMVDSDDALTLEGGECTILASLEQDGELIATATATVFIGPRIEEGASNLPFEVQDNPGVPTAPRWVMQDPVGPGDPYVLRYSSADPVYAAVRDLRRPIAGSDRRPVEDYLAQIIAEGLVEWAVRVFRSRGDEGRLRLMSRGAEAVSQELADKIEDRIERLIGAIDDVATYGKLQRELAALMTEAARRARR